MGNLFNPDALLWRWCSRILDVMVLSILWFFCSLPAVTAGAASAALYDAAVHGIRRDEPGAYARFLRTFRRELKTGCLASLLWGAVIAAPLLSAALQAAARWYWNYEIGFELLVYNALFTIAGMFILVKRHAK